LGSVADLWKSGLRNLTRIYEIAVNKVVNICWKASKRFENKGF
jgi:hypothetical protein